MAVKKLFVFAFVFLFVFSLSFPVFAEDNLIPPDFEFVGQESNLYADDYLADSIVFYNFSFDPDFDYLILILDSSGSVLYRSFGRVVSVGGVYRWVSVSGDASLIPMDDGYDGFLLLESDLTYSGPDQYTLFLFRGIIPSSDPYEPVTSGLGSVISWVGMILGSLLSPDGVLFPLFFILVLGIGVSAFNLVVRFLFYSIWGL